MRVEIVDIGNGNTFRGDKERMVGQKGTFATATVKDKGFCSGTFYPDSYANFYSREPYFFRELKTKPIFDA